MKVQKTIQGDRYVKFTGTKGEPYAIQDSSPELLIWFGTDFNGRNFCGRIHLSRAQVQDLLPLLQHFAETGVLPEPEES
jgi:hypothetical protein